MDFFEEMQQMARELLAPTSQGGFGQGRVVLVRNPPAVANPAGDWEEPGRPSPLREVVGASVSGALPAGQQSQEYGDGVVILSTDLKVLTAVPQEVDWRMDPKGVVLELEIDGKLMTVLRSKGIMAAGIPAAIEFIVRR